MKYCFVFLFFLSFFIACTSVRQTDSIAAQHKTYVRKTDLPFQIITSQNGKETHILITATSHVHDAAPIPLNTGPLASEYRKFNRTELDIYDSNNTPLWHNAKAILMNQTYTSEPGWVDVTEYTDYAWVPSQNVSTSFMCTADARAYYNDGTLVFDTTVSFIYTPPKEILALRMNIEPQDDHKYRINMDVTRITNDTTEYLPNGLTHDYQIFNDAGVLLWQKSYGGMFTQVIGDVQPKDVGASVDYTDLWDGEGNVVPGIVPGGRYTLVGIIPCMPNPVQDSLHFFIK